MLDETLPMCPRCHAAAPAGAELGDVCEPCGYAYVGLQALQSSRGDAYLGRVVAGKYAIVGRLGAGGMGAVYLALQLPMRREVALKVILADEADDPDTRKRFYREARVVAGLRQTSTVTLHDYGEEDGSLYMVLEYIPGSDLDEVLQREGRLAPLRAVGIVGQILGSLAEAHAAGLIHRDLKPANIRLVEGPFGEEVVKVLDFGIAKVFDPSAAHGGDVFQTTDDLVRGTPEYMAPEQSLGAAPAPTMDVYATGVLLYQMLTGRVPFGGSTRMDIISNAHTQPVPELPANLGVSPELVAVLHKAMAKEAEQRYASAKAMAEALQGCLGPGGPRVGASFAAVPTAAAGARATPAHSGVASAPQGSKRRRVPLWVIVLVVGAALAAVGLGGFAIVAATQ